MTHNELASSLAAHLTRDDRMVWEDIPVGRSGSARPDVLTIEKSFSSPKPTSYEIKVSVSDFRSDITSGKWQKYLEFSSAVVFAVPHGLISRKDIPKGCGLVQFNGQTWHHSKRPTIQTCEMPSELLLKLLMAGNARQSQPAKPYIPRTFDQEKAQASLKKKFGEDMAIKIYELGFYDERMATLDKAKNDLGALFDINVDKWSFYKDVEYHIEELQKLADEDRRRELIATDLTKIREQLDSNMQRLIRDFNGTKKGH